MLDEFLSNKCHNYSFDDLAEEINTRLSDMNPDTNDVSR